MNTYPGYRSFKAIGVGGSGFVRAMVSAVESVVATPVHEECVQERPSSKGSYISVTVGPVLLHNRDQARLFLLRLDPSPRGVRQIACNAGTEQQHCMRAGVHACSCTARLILCLGITLQVVQIYAAMKEDERLKWYM